MKSAVYLITFLEVVNRSTMAEAARQLKITPAAVSKHIQALENELGLQLLKRSTRRVELTANGKIYYEHAKLILKAYADAEIAVSKSKGEPSGLLKVVTGPHFGNHYLLPHLKEFKQRYPKVTLHVGSMQEMPDLEKEMIDVVMGLTSGFPSNCIVQTLLKAKWVLCATPSYLDKYGIPIKPAGLVDHQIITHTSRRPDNRIIFKTGESIYFEPALYFNDTRAMLRSALQDNGIVMLHDYIVENDIKEKRLVPLLGKHMEQEKTIPLYIAHLQTSQVHPKIRAFIDFMLEILKRDHVSMTET